MCMFWPIGGGKCIVSVVKVYISAVKCLCLAILVETSDFFQVNKSLYFYSKMCMFGHNGG